MDPRARQLPIDFARREEPEQYRRCLRAVGCALVALALVANPATQCPTTMLAGEGYPGANSWVLASVVWDPDGAGPRSPLLVVGGNFVAIGNQTSRCIASFDPVTNTWASLGGGMSGNFPEVTALTVLPNGDLIAAGRFELAGGVAANNIARWDGTAWAPLGGGLARTLSTPSVAALTVAGNGDLVACGRFDRAGGNAVQDVARWDGTTWSAMSWMGAVLQTLATLPNGDVVMGGSAGSGQSISRWNGTQWVPLGQVVGNARALAIAANGDLLACGNLMSSGSLSFQVGRWDGLQWSRIPTSFVDCDSIVALANGGIVLGGSFARIETALPAISVAHWNGAQWSALGAGLGNGLSGTNATTVRCLAELPDGTVFAGGTFLNSGNEARAYMARWNGSAWQALSNQNTPISGWIRALVPAESGGFYAATGNGWTAGGVVSPRAARWDGGSWQPMPGMSTPVNGPVSKCLLQAEGVGLLVGGGNSSNSFTALLQRWTGSTWVPFAPGLNDVLTLAQLPNGAIVAGFNNPSLGNLATWTGSAWTPLGGGTNGTVAALRRLRNGDLIVGGGFTQVGSVPANCIARWNGSTWSAIGSGLPGGVGAIDELPNGNLVAVSYVAATGGSFVAEWNGATWTSLGTGMDRRIDALLALPDGDVLAGGWFTTAGGVPATGLARWRGGAWQAVPGVEGYVSALAIDRNGEIGVGGTFWAPALGSFQFVRLASDCAARVSNTAQACNSPGSAILSTPTSLPWLGSTFSIRTTGYANGSVAAVVTGFQAASLPLVNLHPAGQAGCSLLTSVDALRFAFPVGGLVEERLTIPNAPALIGVSLRHQQVQVVLDANGAVADLRSSNLLQSTIGDF